MNERRGAWYLLTGLVFGLVMGLLYSLWLSPIQFSNIAPQSLGDGYKDHYRVLIARAFDADGDIGRAKSRLSLLHDDNVTIVLSAQAQNLLAAGGNPEDAHALAALEEALQNTALPAAVANTLTATQGNSTTSESEIEPTSTQPVQTSTMDPDRAILTPTAQPSDSATVLPSLPPRATPLPDSVVNAVFTVSEKREVCLPGEQEVLLQIEVLDSEGYPLPGLRVQVTWDAGEDYFFTGLYPQVSLGYADFSMQPDVSYNVRVGDRGQLETGLSAVECTTSGGESYFGGWWLTFQVP